jgi:predicted molibdopterin-dependent oxidoreductase YjgC
MTFHFQDDVSVNVLTINASDPKAGTAEFKACAVNVEPLEIGSTVELFARASATNGHHPGGEPERVPASAAGD